MAIGKENTALTCEVSCINENKVGFLKKQMKSEKIIAKLAATFKTLGDPTRTKIIYALSKEELCVCEIAAVLDASQSAVSHQLRVLRNMELVRCRKDGNIAYYSLDDAHINSLWDVGLRHVIE